MKRHGIFELPPRGLRWYCTDIKTCTGVWLPLPIYWLLLKKLDLKIAWLAHCLRVQARQRRAVSVKCEPDGWIITHWSDGDVTMHHPIDAEFERQTAKP